MSTDRGLLPQQKENARHGESGFPIQRYRTTLHATYQDVPTHWHEEAELTLIVRGGSTYTVQLESEQVKEGDIVFVPPQVLHAVNTGGGEMDSDTFVFHPNLLGAATADVCTLRYLAPLCAQKLTPPTVIRRDHPAYDQLLRLIRDMNRTWETREIGWELMIKAQLLTVLAILMPFCTKDSAELALRTEHAEKIKTALEFMDKNYGEEIAIADVAAACYFSQYHFMRFFKKYMGMSCGEYLKNLRLEKAAQAFARGNTVILDVAMDAGFRNLSYFYREFQKKYGYTPKQFIHRCVEMPRE
ncbi:MAG: AraC family transcriptional regulator [Oscillospiraceae bacterium]|nr:AraC family transcriptional regulator [Oscillospiraceae bacterium]